MTEAAIGAVKRGYEILCGYLQGELGFSVFNVDEFRHSFLHIAFAADSRTFSLLTGVRHRSLNVHGMRL